MNQPHIPDELRATAAMVEAGSEPAVTIRTLVS